VSVVSIAYREISQFTARGRSPGEQTDPEQTLITLPPLYFLLIGVSELMLTVLTLKVQDEKDRRNDETQQFKNFRIWAHLEWRCLT